MSLLRKLSLYSVPQVLTNTSVATKCYVINCEVTNPNVPYGDKFNIVKRYCLTRGRTNTCKLRLTSDVQYKKGVWGMVKCESNTRIYFIGRF